MLPFDEQSVPTLGGFESLGVCARAGRTKRERSLARELTGVGSTTVGGAPRFGYQVIALIRSGGGGSGVGDGDGGQSSGRGRIAICVCYNRQYDRVASAIGINRRVSSTVTGRGRVVRAAGIVLAAQTKWYDGPATRAVLSLGSKWDANDLVEGLAGWDGQRTPWS